MVPAGVSSSWRVDSAVSAQAPNPCALITVDDIEALAANESVADSVPDSQAFGSVA